MTRTVDLVIPVKALPDAKTRLVATSGLRDHDRHRRAVLALLTDTVAAALAAEPVRRVVVITPDDHVADAARTAGAEPLDDTTSGGLNAAIEHGERHLRAQDPVVAIGALLADLPALRPKELAAAVRAARGGRAFCPDADGTGTTLLLGAEGGQLRPQFGPSSARAHQLSGAFLLHGPWPSLRRDVDTLSDLHAAADLGLGHHTTAMLATELALAPVAAGGGYPRGA
ncbi:2-phospho-L-lactate guanylyltransferase [Haloechinothrix sp. LS1_15]|uniref:2-phospho-L-lactate guanylyltransferase n=1 Tax=Haloechinothrix sp. LS1_15 TaxID=2652248 RepID=UPI0029466E08|nr:2-phospho-L-lactate guanylyltransferase [Haloechinothrix sp. LS1_15]MDV6012899.1 2-phospho-L-lactate guanylyltransferase [Haloechinothrix sp. LS1_15]